MSIPASAYSLATPAPDSRWPALFEVLALPVLAAVVAVLLAALLGTHLVNPFASLQPEAPPESWLPLTAQLLQVLALQYAGILLLVMAILLPRHEFSRRRFGLTRNGVPLSRLLRMGLLLACVLVPLQLALMAADAQWNLGDTAPWRRALLDAPRTSDFWLLMAVGSFGLVPLLEEGFYRGVLQGRLQQVMPAGHAIVLTSVLFTLSHTQYNQASLINLATFALVLLSALTFGWLFWKTGSVWPGVIAHAAINVPWPQGATGLAMMAVLLAIAAVTRRHWWPALNEMREMLGPCALGAGLLAPLLLTIAFYIGLAVASIAMVLVSALMLGAALVWRSRLRRRAPVAS
jgi:membrane protease YdiL (CAAX protease family)